MKARLPLFLGFTLALLGGDRSVVVGQSSTKESVAETAPAVATQPAHTGGVTTAPAPTGTLPVPEGAANAIIKLGSPEERERRKASEALVHMGLAVKPLLENLLSRSTDLETITRARAALAQIDEDRLIGPSYITLHVKDGDPRAVAAELSRQCFADLKVFPDNLWEDNPAKVTIDVDHEPFWVVMRQFTAQTGLSLQQYNEGFRLMRGGQALTGPWMVRGPFMAIAETMTRLQIVQLVAGKAPGQAVAAVAAAPANGRGDFNLQMFAVAEPKLEVVRNTASVRVTEAVDDNGNSLLLTGAASRSIFGSSGRFWNLVARLSWPSKNAGKRIVRFRAVATFAVQTKVQHFEIHDPLHMKEQANIIGGVQVTMRSLTKNGDSYNLKLVVAADVLGTPAWASLQQSLLMRLHLRDDHGEQLEHRGQSTHVRPNEVEFDLPFEGGQLPNGNHVGDPAMLVWDVPTETREISVPIAFDDLPMPQ